MTPRFGVRRFLAAYLAFVLTLCGMLPALVADEPRVIIFDADGRETSGSLQAISHTAVRIGGQSAEWKWSDVVWLRFGQIENLPHEPRGSAIWLANGDRLIARGTAIEDEQLRATWREFPEWSTFALPLESVRGLSLSLPHARERRDEIATWLFDRKEARDEMRLLNGDVTSGEVSGWREGTIELKAAGRGVSLPIAGVRDIAFNPSCSRCRSRKNSAGWSRCETVRVSRCSRQRVASKRQCSERACVRRGVGHPARCDC